MNEIEVSKTPEAPAVAVQRPCLKLTMDPITKKLTDIRDAHRRESEILEWRAKAFDSALIAIEDEEGKLTYWSYQKTKCAGCGEQKHTPLRKDSMGGYVCLTCIDKRMTELSERLGELEDTDVPQYASRIKALEELICHMVVHSAYKECGYDQMTSLQKQLRDAVWSRCVEKQDAPSGQNDLALAQTPRENAGDTPHAQTGASVETEREGGCCQQRLVLPLVLLEDRDNDGVKWSVSFDGANPPNELCVRCASRDEAEKLKLLVEGRFTNEYPNL